MSGYNIHGLSRTIPESVKRKIRQDSGFGCVICGTGIFEYEHIIPEYHEAKEHEPSCMTLLCPTCHGKVTKGLISKETVLKYKKTPKPLSDGFSHDWLDFNSSENPKITLGGSVLKKCTVPLEIFGYPIISIKPPVEENTPFLLSAMFFDKNEKLTLEIVDNEWKSFSDNWDMQVVGPRIKIFDSKKKLTLCLLSDPPNGLVVEYLVMNFKGNSIIIEPDYISLNSNKFYGGIFWDSSVGFSIS